MNLHVSPQRATDDLLTRANLRLRIGEHVIDVGALRMVTRPELPRLTSKGVAVLIELVRHVGTTVTRDHLLDRVWTGRFPTPDVLTQAIKELRRAFADDAKPSQYIETIPKVGYRLIASVLVLDGPEGGIYVESAHSLDADADRAEPASPPVTAANAASANGQQSAARWWIPAVAIVVVLAALAFFVPRMRTSPSPEHPTFKATNVRALTSDPGPERRPHISPDGTRIAFGVNDKETNHDRIVVQSVEGSERVHLTVGSNQHEAAPVWSPDGTRIAFERLDVNYCVMFVASSLGGAEREVGPCRDYVVNYYDWTPDGKDLITAHNKDGGDGVLSLMRWELATGQKHFLDYQRRPEDQDLEPRYSPDGRWIAFRRGVAPYSDLYVMDANDGNSVRQVTHVSARIRGYTWANDSQTIVLATNFEGTIGLYAIDIDGGPLQRLGISPAEYPDAARVGNNVVYEIPRSRNTVAFVPIKEGVAPDPKPLTPSTGSDFNGVLSPTGDRIAFVSDRSGQVQLWLYDRASEIASPLTNNSNVAVFSPRWSSDGKRIVAVQHSAEGRKLVELEISTQRQRVLSKPGENVLFGIYGPDPDTYLIAIGTSGRDNQLFLVEHPATPDEKRRALASSVAYADVDMATRAVYYTEAKQGLSRLDLNGGTPTLITSKVNAVTMNGWHIVDGRVWFIGGLGDKPTVLNEFDPATGKEREVARLNVALQDVNFSVMPNRDGVIVAPVGVEDTDVGIFELTRTATP